MKIRAWVWWVAVLAAVACGGDDSERGVAPDANPNQPPSILGIYNEVYNCDEAGTCVDPRVMTTVEITAGNSPDEYFIADLASDWAGTGTLVGTTFTWTATTSEYSESGVWEFANDRNSFSKTSSYAYNAGGGGMCTGEAVRLPGTPPNPAPIGDCP